MNSRQDAVAKKFKRKRAQRHERSKEQRERAHIYASEQASDVGESDFV